MKYLVHWLLFAKHPVANISNKFRVISNKSLHDILLEKFSNIFRVISHKTMNDIFVSLIVVYLMSSGKYIKNMKDELTTNKAIHLFDRVHKVVNRDNQKKNWTGQAIWKIVLQYCTYIYLEFFHGFYIVCLLLLINTKSTNKYLFSSHITNK